MNVLDETEDIKSYSEQDLKKAFASGCNLTEDAWEEEDWEKWETFYNSLKP